MEATAPVVPCSILGLPNELGQMIYNYVLDDALQLSGSAYGFEDIGSAISQVCRDWRSDFFQAPARTPLPRRLQGKVSGRELRVEQALWFQDLVELADFFHGDTGLNHHNVLRTIEFISVAYVDLHYARACEWTTAWAYQACYQRS